MSLLSFNSKREQKKSKVTQRCKIANKQVDGGLVTDISDCTGL